jgi:glucoamylase
MSRSLVLGNGAFFLNFDDRLWIRDVYFPHLGIENHSQGHAFRFGVRVDGHTHWIGDEWEREIRYEPDTFVGLSTLRHRGIGLEVQVRDAVDFQSAVFCRQITVHNLERDPREVRLFLHHDFRIAGTDVGDTAYYDPDLDAVVHHKRDRYFMVGGGRPGSLRPDEFATGRKGFGAEGTWRDADGGTLSGNPIAQGSVDSIIGMHLQVPAGGSAVAYYWIAAGERYGELLELNSTIRRGGPGALIERTARYWRLWLERSRTFAEALPDDLARLYTLSLLIMRSHVDAGGAIIAALDSDITHFARDTYSYMWPRDGALVAAAFDDAGFPAVSRRFFGFAAGLLKREGYFLHKYHPDRSLASSWHPWIDGRGRKVLPIQEDETGLVVWSLWQHFERYGDVEEVQPLYGSLIVRAGEFMADYRDAATGLPLPSWDLWEERRGVVAFTCAAVWAGLDAAANFARAFGDSALELRFAHAAEEVRSGFAEHMWDRDAGRYARMLSPGENGSAPVLDSTADSALFGLHYLGMFGAEDPKLNATLESVVAELAVRTDVGGMARYHGDYYHAVTSNLAEAPGNPWFIGQCWRARWLMARAGSREELDAALEPLHWIAAHATSSLLLPEQVHPFTGAPLAVTPLTWSHAAFVSAIHDYMARRERLDACAVCGAVTTRAGAGALERGLQ